MSATSTSVPPAIGRWLGLGQQRVGLGEARRARRPAARSRASSRGREPAPAGGQGDRLDDLGVARAAAQVARDRLADGRVGRGRRRTPGTPRAAISMPGVQIPHWAPPVSRKAVWSRSRSSRRPAARRPAGEARPSTVRTVVAVDLADGHEARVDDRAVEEDRAGAALALAAALLRAGQAEVLAQDVEQAAHARARRARPGSSLTVKRTSSWPAGSALGGAEQRPAPASAARIRSGLAGRSWIQTPGRIVDRRDDRRRADVHRQLADPLGAVRARR